MAEKRSGESSDSEVYLSADEGLGSSRGSGERVKIERVANKTTSGEFDESNTDQEERSNGKEKFGEIETERTGETEGKAEIVEEEDEKLRKPSDSTTESAVEKEEVNVRENDSVKDDERREQGENGEENHIKDEPAGKKKEQELMEKEDQKISENVTERDSRRTEVKEKEKEKEKEEEEKAPIPPPRRKRKKKIQKNPSLEDLEKLMDDVEIQRSTRSMTIGGYDMTRECKTVMASSLSSSSSSTTSKPLGSGVRGAKFSPPVKPPRQRRGSKSDGHHQALTNVPSISIEPDTSLELTEEMVHGQAKVISRDTPHAKAYGSDNIEGEIIYDTDDESEGEGVYGSQELVPVASDHVDSGPDVPSSDQGPSEEVVAGGEKERDNSKGQKEKTPMAEEEEEEEESNLPSDNQILQMTIVKNLDTGDSFPLSVVNEKIPLGNPLNQHLYRRTAAMESHGEEGSGEEGHHRRRTHNRRKKFKNFWGKKRMKGHGDGVVKTREGEAINQEQDTAIKYKPSSHHKGPYDFDKVRLRQDLTGPHLGAVWVMEFSICGRLLAVAGQDSIVRVWVLRPAAQFFHELQAKYQRFGIHSSGESLAEKASMASTTSSEEDDVGGARGPFLEQPICTYHGHSADVLDLSWSKNFFLLSSSMDKTVRLWHISRKECLCCFQHVDFVTAIAFHPRDDRYFLSGSLDGKLRLWNIPDKRVALWNEIEGVGSHLITAANFCMNGKLAVAGTYDGRCIFYETEHLKYHTQIHVKSRHGKNRGRKVSGIEPLPGEDKILVTTNDSRLRLYNLKDHSLSCKYKGGLNTSSQIRATFSRDGLSIICGSEDNFIYVWRTHHDTNKLSSVRRDRNELYESFTTHHAPVTAAIFAPVPGITVDQGLKEVGQMIIAADYQGGIKVYVNSEKL